MKEKKDRVDDALHATRAVEEGIVSGGGVALLNARKVIQKIKSENPDEATGSQIVYSAVEAPLRTIVSNAGGEGSVVVSKVEEGKANFGYDAKSETYVDDARCWDYRSQKGNSCGLGKCCLCCRNGTYN